MSLAIRPFIEKDKVKLWLGAPLAAMAIVGGVTNIPQNEDALMAWSVEQPVSQLIDSEYELPVVTNESGFGMPVVTLTGVSQRYHAGHPGVDMRAPLNSDVVAVDAGVIDEVITSAVGYGNHVYMTHENKVRSLYAHLDVMTVSPGQYVQKGQPLGTVGMTGLSTGPHVHFEMYVEEGRTNPIFYIQDAIVDYQKNLVI